MPPGSPIVRASGRGSVTRPLSASAILDNRLAAEFLQILVADALGLRGHQLVLGVVACDRIAGDAPRRAYRDHLDAVLDFMRGGGFAGRCVLYLLAFVARKIADGPPADILDDHVLECLRPIDALVATGKAQAV